MIDFQKIWIIMALLETLDIVSKDSQDKIFQFQHCFIVESSHLDCVMQRMQRMSSSLNVGGR